MRTQSPDTSPEAERKLIERIRQAPVSRRFRLVQSLSQRMLAHPDAEQHAPTQAIRAITIGYGQRIGQRVQAALTARPGWQEQPVDLSATLFPVMHALAAVGFSLGAVSVYPQRSVRSGKRMLVEISLRV